MSDTNNLSIELQASSSSGPVVCRYKGVVAHPNGHWGSQIYANHQRVWLGTFKTELEAAMAYDSAALKLRTGSYRNLPTTSASLDLEANFQSHYSDEDILTMIKDGSYSNKLRHFVLRSEPERSPRGDVVCRDYFEKELTASDVGKLNRLVIPKKYAVKFFPHVDTEQPDGLEVSEAELEFFDKGMRRWTFHYCYWKSSQSYVLTKGWNKFVKDKGLKTRDTVIFYNWETMPSQPGARGGPTVFSMIDFQQREDDDGPSKAAEDGQGQKRELRLFGVDIM